MIDALLLPQAVGHGLDGLCRAAHHDHLGAGVVIEVDVRGREHMVVVGVLHLGELAAQVARFVGPEACAALNELYAVLRDYNNFLFPSVKLVEKTRNGARVTKRYDKPQPPYQRMLNSPEIPRRIKNKLRAHYETLNPAALHRRILALQKRLAALAVRTTGEEATA